MVSVPLKGDPKTNYAAVLTEIGRIELEKRPMPAPASDEVLVRVEAVGVCGSDIHYFQDGRVGSYVIEQPLVLGHETAGTVVEVGASVHSIEVGARVAIEPGTPCGRCVICREGRYNLCRHVLFHATPPVDGTLQQYVSVRADFVYPLPDSVSTTHGALIEPLAVAIWACRKANVGPGKSVLITGAGAIGLLALQVALASGATRVVVTDMDEDRLELARSLGASRAISAGALDGSDREEFDVLVECSGSISATRTGLEALGSGGTAVLVGMGAADDLALPVALIQERELVITGTFRYANCYPAAIDLVAAGHIQLAPLITGHFRLEDTAQALSRNAGKNVIKNLILPNTWLDISEEK